MVDAGKPITGRAEVQKAFEKIFAGLTWVVQLAPNAVFEVDEAEGTGTGRVMIQETNLPKKGTESSLFAVYHDRYQRVDGQWLFAERTREINHRS